MANNITVGRRKTAVARVFLTPGSGKTTVNGKDLETYFPIDADRRLALGPLESVEMLGRFDVQCNVHGGGRTGQVGAVRHAIARALVDLDPELRPVLKRDGHMTRDPRMVERKKYGQKKARKRFQFSKR